MSQKSPALSRRAFLRSAAAATCALGASQASARPADVPQKGPNILLIMVDDLGNGDLASHGAKDMRTPHIDALMDAGMRFDQFYANCPVCSPTRAALLSGRYPDRAGVPGVIRTYERNSWGYLREDMDLLPSVLRRVGYHTAMVGKWHLGLEAPNKPNARGFDHFKGFLGDMMDDYDNHRRHGIDYMRENNTPIYPHGHATDLFSQWSVDYIKYQQTAEAPFFLYLAYNAPHTPIEPPEGWLEKVKAREPGIDEKRALLVALIEHLDDGIGKVVQSLKDTGQYEDTLIIFCSDNGGHVSVGATNGPVRGGKQDMYEGGIKVPMCISWPAKITPGQRSDAPTMSMDFYPTLCELAKVPYDRNIDGANILPDLLGTGAVDPERTMIWMRREGGHYGGQDYYAIRRGPWKLLQNSPFEPLQLYNLDDDPMEANPVAKHPMKKTLNTALREHINQTGSIPWQRSKG
ncbi:MAG: sulfatase-like hydrolase/transferase [Candidatus Hydrogenedentes bacterium]|nr:sulfatase-like hydrolase/transferase [Candidatus Hydrogenedentota bacterium]